MQIAVFGLGKMGMQIVRRLHNHNVTVFAWNRSTGPVEDFNRYVMNLQGKNAALSSTSRAYGAVEDVLAHYQAAQRVFWLMLPSDVIGDFLEKQLGPHLRAGDIVIDGGNTYYKETVKRAETLKARGIVFYDCGTSGGVWGEANGFALMVGGSSEHWQVVEPYFKILSAGTNYGLVGKNGAGHFAKMVHNGIEYGMMEAIGEGYAVLKASPFEYDFLKLTAIYQHGTVIRSWLIDLVKNIFEKEDLENTKGEINMLGEGEWTVEAGKELGVDVRVLEDSVQVRKESKDPKNQNKFSNKIVALLRKQFGGHGVEKSQG